ncbi:hypothetical protein llap_19319 [Limosa lapponica baueri]|uniref:RNA transcription, translation and transport factor protein n=1 Tax=Limosa lapponica baueri TaxID=1758121 RepID=A0A2I0T9B4_LIMLA|nr:hypothetical protein llap_19319 [Limosa lapponica baueri]
MMTVIFTVNNPDFKAGVMALANLLQIQRHDDYLVMLKEQQISSGVEKRQGVGGRKTALSVPAAIISIVMYWMNEEDLLKAERVINVRLLHGRRLYAVLNEAAQILRLLHIEELRELQTKINEAIVAVQAIIADPKTDHRLGKVGR